MANANPGRRTSAALRLGAETVLLVTAYVAYEAVRRLVAPDSSEAIGRAMNLMRLEQRAGIFVEPHLQRHFVEHEWLVMMCNWVYVWGYLPVICAMAVYLYVWHREYYARYRNAFLLSGAAGLLIFAMLPVAPPRMFPELGFVDTVRANSAIYRLFEGSKLVNEFAAVPSFHFGWILLVGLALVETARAPAMRAAGLLLPPLMLFAVLLTANHFVIDAAAGGALALLALGAVRLAERRRPSGRGGVPG